MSAGTIVPIVEGHGEVPAVPELLRRLLPVLTERYDITIGGAVRKPGGSLLTADGMGRAVRQALGRDACDAILVIKDGEDGCPKTDGPVLLDLLRQALQARGQATLLASAVIAYREFETWFIAGLESPELLALCRPGVEAPPVPESRRDAKGLLRQMLASGAYSPAWDQVRLVGCLDPEITRRRSDSFDKLCREVIGLAQGLPPSPP